jgi:hypothetical protein
MRSCLALALLVVALAACRRNPAHDLGPHAHTSLVFTNDAARGGSFETFFATEAEVLRSKPVLDMVFEQLGRQVSRDHLVIEAERRGDTSILDIRVAMPDPAVARDVCGQLVQQYIALRRVTQHTGVAQVIASMADEYERTKSTADRELLHKRMLDLEIQERALAVDVRGLEPCTMVTQ